MLKGKVAVVTDSTSGIGLGIARALAAAGSDLMINGFREAAAIEKLRQEIAAAHGVRVAHTGADLSKPADSAALIEHATRELGPRAENSADKSAQIFRSLGLRKSFVSPTTAAVAIAPHPVERT
jgi:NAD(P)-dependent dehydrogenase (short-subunit alcohol dehydrogenase family)